MFSSVFTFTLTSMFSSAFTGLCVGLLAGVLAVLMARRVEIEPPIVVLLTVEREGAPIMKLNGKSRIILSGSNFFLFFLDL